MGRWPSDGAGVGGTAVGVAGMGVGTAEGVRVAGDVGVAVVIVVADGRGVGEGGAGLEFPQATAAIVPAMAASMVRREYFGALRPFTVPVMPLRLQRSPGRWQGLELVGKLRPVSFRWVDGHDDGRAHLGFIAQEVEGVLPDLVATMDDGDTLAISSVELIPVLVRAIQELRAEVEALKSGR